MWRKSKQVERAACDRLLADLGTVLQYRAELSEIGPVLTRLVGRGDGVVIPSVQHFALQQQLASLTATMADHETAILELERQVASLEPGVQSLDTKVRELGVLLSESMSVVEDRIKVMDEDRISELERKVSGVCCDSEKRQLVVEMEKRLRDTEPFVAVVAQLETRVEKMEQLEVQFVNLWGLANLTEVVVAELRTKFQSRVTNLEQWGDTVAESLYAVQCRVENLEHRW